MNDKPSISVLVALPDHRGHAAACIEKWTRTQTLPREQYEVVIAADTGDPQLERHLQFLLGPQDRLIREPGASLHRLYNIGARHARGRWLLLTESHCLAQPDCLEKLLDHLDRSPWDGASLASDGLNSTMLAAMEQRIYDEALSFRTVADAWNSVTIRGFALRRCDFLACGGCDERFGHFAEVLLGAVLHEAGLRFDYASDAIVQHSNTARLSELLPSLVEFGEREIRCRAELPADFCNQYFGLCSAWSRRATFRRSIALAKGWEALCAFGLGQLLRHGLAMLFGPQSRRVQSSLSLGIARAVFAAAILFPRLRYRAYRRLWQRSINHGRQRAIVAWLRTNKRDASAMQQRSRCAPTERMADLKSPAVRG